MLGKGRGRGVLAGVGGLGGEGEGKTKGTETSATGAEEGEVAEAWWIVKLLFSTGSVRWRRRVSIAETLDDPQ